MDQDLAWVAAGINAISESTRFHAQSHGRLRSAVFSHRSDEYRSCVDRSRRERTGETAWHRGFRLGVALARLLLALLLRESKHGHQMILTAVSRQSRLRKQVEYAFERFMQREAVQRSQNSIVAFAREVANENHENYLDAGDESEVIALLGGRTADSYQLELMRLLASPPL